MIQLHKDLQIMKIALIALTVLATVVSGPAGFIGCAVGFIAYMTLDR